MGHSCRRIGVRAAAPTAERESRLAPVHLLSAMARPGLLYADRASVHAAAPLSPAEADLRTDPAPGAALDLLRRGSRQGNIAGTPARAMSGRPAVRISDRRRQCLRASA